MAVKIKKAVIPVAGLGTRMLPATKAIPKELLPVFDRPIIEHVVREAIAGGITEIILVTRSGKEAIENHFDAHYELEHRLEKKGKQNILVRVKNIIPENVNVTSIRQADALGLGHAILCAKNLLNGEPFVVLLPDVLVLDQICEKEHHSFVELVKAWEETGIGQILVEKVDADDVEKYGIADLNGFKINPYESVTLKGLVEKPSKEEAPSDLAVVGRYALPNCVLDFLELVSAGVGDEIQLTDALDELISKEGLNALKTSASTYDCGTKEGFLGANLAVGIRDPKIKAYLRQRFEVFKN